METLVGRLRRIFSWKKKDKKTVVSQAYRPSSWRMDRLEKALDAWQARKGWREPVRTVGEAAERLGTDTGTLYTYFRERIGLDFRTWRTRLRLEDAKQMLADNPALHPADAGRLCGFSNRSNFSRQFLAYTGQTPAEWQKKAGMSHDSPAGESVSFN
ncbi:MAG: AraC family transcriptional regulator [Bacteroidales bacterium]|nr:AraC family transcriptional regulator [Bacteroidales bacterium]